MLNRSIVAAAALLSFAACAPRATLVPAPAADAAPGPPGGAISTEAGVTVSAWPEQWDADPPNLVTHVTPLLVRMENQGDTEVLVRFANFRLMNPVGEDFSAIPPFELDGTVTEPIRVPRFTTAGFRVAPHLRHYYPQLDPFAGPFALDRGFWTRHRTAWVDIPLPTADMIAMALPEGVLEPGGVAMGFVYFEPVEEVPALLTMEYDLVGIQGQMLGSVEIPFAVETADF